MALDVLAETHHCYVRSSFYWEDENGKYQGLVAQTPMFKVIPTREQPEYSLPLVDRSGTRWGEVMVSTGTDDMVNTVNTEILYEGDWFPGKGSLTFPRTSEKVSAVSTSNRDDFIEVVVCLRVN